MHVLIGLKYLINTNSSRNETSWIPLVSDKGKMKNMCGGNRYDYLTDITQICSFSLFNIFNIERNWVNGNCPLWYKRGKFKDFCILNEPPGGRITQSPSRPRTGSPVS